jgi:hypothetical protein
MTFRKFSASVRWLTGISSIPEYDYPLSPLPRKMALRCHNLTNWLSGIDWLQKVIVRVTESRADCWKERRSITLTRQSHLINLFAAENGFMLLLWWCPFKIKKEKWPGLQFTRTDYLSLVLTPLRIRWTIPLSRTQPSNDISAVLCILQISTACVSTKLSTEVGGSGTHWGSVAQRLKHI